MRKRSYNICVIYIYRLVDPEERVDIGRFLLATRADVDGKDGSGNTPIMVAAGAGFAEMVRLLRDRG